jgi:hypothetical protein
MILFTNVIIYGTNNANESASADFISEQALGGQTSAYRPNSGYVYSQIYLTDSSGVSYNGQIYSVSIPSPNGYALQTVQIPWAGVSSAEFMSVIACVLLVEGFLTGVKWMFKQMRGGNRMD